MGIFVRILFIVFGLFSIIGNNGCSGLCWRNKELDPGYIISGKSKIMFQVVYLERDSWNPMMGTTYKKSYQTRLTLIQPDGNEKILPNLTSWVLPGKVIYLEDSDQLFWIQGLNDEFGTLNRKIGVANGISRKEFIDKKFWEGEKEIISIKPSPNGELIAIVFQRTEDTGEVKYFFTVWNHSSSPAPTSIHSLPYWDDSDGISNPNYELIWVSDSAFQIKMEKRLWTWTNGTIKQ